MAASSRPDARATRLAAAGAVGASVVHELRNALAVVFKHGPIAIVDPQLVSIVVAAQDGPMLEGLTELLGPAG